MEIGKLEMKVKTKGLKQAKYAFKQMSKYAIKASKALDKLEEAICEVKEQLPLEIQIDTGASKNG